jgi:K+-sensing histidine kinase KdpD
MNRPASAPTVPETRLLNRATGSAAVMAGAIFAIDLVTPRAAGVGMLYVLPLLVGTLKGPPRFQFVAATVVSVLALAGYLLKPGETESLTRSARAIAILVIWTTAIVLRQFRQTWLELQARSVDLQARTKDGPRISPTRILPSTRPPSSPPPTPAAKSPTSTASSATSRSTRARNCSARITA